MEQSEAMRMDIARLEKKVADLERKVEDIASRDAPITVREVMRILERHVCLKIAGGSKNRAKKELYNFARIRDVPALAPKP